MQSTGNSTLYKPAQRRLLAPLIAVCLLLVAGLVGLLISTNQKNLNKSALSTLEGAIGKLDESLDVQSKSLSAVEKALLSDSDLHIALKNLDKERLFNDCKTVFTKLRAEHGITHFYFHTPSRVNLLRVHKPEKYGDFIDRFTAREAERTGNTASGIELGPLGTFTLRVVRPVWEGATLIGYLELGKEIEDILSDIHKRLGVELTVSIHKKQLSKAQFQGGMTMLGREADWDRYEKEAVIYSSLSRFPSAFDNFISGKEHLHHNVTAEATFSGKLWRVMLHPMKDVSGTDVGDMIVLLDISKAKDNFNRFLVTTVGLALVFLLGLVGFVYVLLRRTDRAIQVQQSALSHSEKQHRIVLDAINASGLLLIIIDSEYRVRYMNAPMIEAFGDIVGKICFKYIAKIGNPCAQCRLKEVINNQAVIKYESKSYNGRRLDIVAVPYTDIDGSACQLEIIQDITKRKQTENALQESEQRLREIIDLVPNFIFAKDIEGTFILVNKAVADAYGTTVEELTGKTDADFATSDEEVRNFREHDLAVIRSGKPQIIPEESITDAQGKTRCLSTVKIPFTFSGNGNPAVLGISTDITAHKESEKALRKSEERLQQSQKLESIGTLAGGIAHDFNNILFPIIGYTEMLLADVPDESPMQHKLEGIYAGALRARDLVKQILTFSRQDINEVKLISIEPLIKEALKLARATIPTSIVIKQDVKKNCGLIKADPTQIHQVVMNLTTNAYHAMEEAGGELKVSLAGIELDQQDVQSMEMAPGHYVRLVVTDTGVGMSKKLVKKVFDPYFTTKEQGKGTGMGLSVVHGIVKNAGGSIKVYSEPNKGTEFQVFLPAATTPLDRQTIQANVSIQHGTERILLVDDEDAIVSVERQMLERLGYSVTSRTSSIEALKAFRANPEKFDLVISDMTMPNMSGDLLAAELIKIRPEIPILLCTGFSEKLSEENTEIIGISGLLLKPIIIKEMSRKIREVLDNVQEKST